MKKTERVVQFYDLTIAAFSRTFTAPKTIGVRQMFDLMQLVPRHQQTKELSLGEELLYIADWNWSGDIVSILVNKSDKTLSDPVFTVPAKNQRRTAAKQKEEGQDFSVHVVVKLPKEDFSPALVVVESCSGLGVLVLKRLFDQILVSAKTFAPEQFQQNDPDGSVDKKGRAKKYNLAFKCIFAGHLSDELKSDLEKGKVHSIELITDKNRDVVFDGDSFTREKCKTVVLTLIDEANPVRDKFSRITSVFDRNKDKYSQARIKFKTADDFERVLFMDAAEGLNHAYVKKAKLSGFGKELEASYTAFDNQILEKMKKELEA